MALWFRTFSTFLGRSGIWLEDLFVRPEQRRRGHGLALLRHLRTLTDGRVEWVVLDWNTSAQTFYDDLGAAPVPGWTRYRWLPEVASVSGSDLAGLFSRCLRAAGVTRAFRAPGHELPAPAGIDVIDVPAAELAVLLADADGRLAGAPAPRPGLALLPGRRIRLSSQPGEEVLAQPAPRTVGAAGRGRGLDGRSRARRPRARPRCRPRRSGGRPGAARLRARRRPAGHALPEPRFARHRDRRRPWRRARRPGPGCRRGGPHAPARASSPRSGRSGHCALDDPAWRGVVGLQVADGAMAGLEGAELVVVAGLDPAETVGVVPDDAQVLEVEPWHLGLMAHRWPEPGAGWRGPGTRSRPPRRAGRWSSPAAVGSDRRSLSTRRGPSPTWLRSSIPTS